jgi:hypothetical protein
MSVVIYGLLYLMRPGGRKRAVMTTRGSPYGDPPDGEPKS